MCNVIQRMIVDREGMKNKDRMSTCRLSFGLLSGLLSGNQIYIKCLGIIITE